MRYPRPASWVKGCFRPSSRSAVCLPYSSRKSEPGPGAVHSRLSSISRVLLPCSIRLGRWVPSGSWFRVRLSPTVSPVLVLTLAWVFGCTLSGSLVSGCCCSWWCFSGPPSCVVSACCKSSSPPPSIPGVLSLSFSLAYCPSATPFMSFAIRFVMPPPHSLSSSWRASHVCSLSCSHVIIPNHCASSRAACPCTKLVRCPTVQCSCVSSCACCFIVLSMRLLQSLGVAGASLLILRYPFSFLSFGSNKVTPAVCTAMDVATVAISIPISMDASLLPSPATPASWSLLSLPLKSVITFLKEASSFWSSIVC